MIYTMCIHSKAKVFVSTFALLSLASLLERNEYDLLTTQSRRQTSASGVTDMGLFQSFDVLSIGALGKVQESVEYQRLFDYSIRRVEDSIPNADQSMLSFQLARECNFLTRCCFACYADEQTFTLKISL